jgi:hypothetical protein
MSSESSSPRSDGDSARNDGYQVSEVRHVTKEDGSVETLSNALVSDPLLSVGSNTVSTNT